MKLRRCVLKHSMEDIVAGGRDEDHALMTQRQVITFLQLGCNTERWREKDKLSTSSLIRQWPFMIQLFLA